MPQLHGKLNDGHGKRLPALRLQPRLPGALSCGALLLAALLGTGPGCSSGGGDEMVTPSPLTPGSVDLFVSGPRTASTLELEDRDFTAADCAVIDGLVGGSGTRRLLRFDTMIANMGALDLILGNPTSPEPPFTTANFELGTCHAIYTFTGFSQYELRDGSGAVVGLAHKQAFCLRDSIQLEAETSHGYNCDYQGISPGWADLYASTIDGQWVDVTGVPEGDYTLVMTANPIGAIPEVHNSYANVATVAVQLPDPSLPLP